LLLPPATPATNKPARLKLLPPPIFDYCY